MPFPKSPTAPTNGKSLSVAQIGEQYRQWYLSEHVDIGSVKARAAALNEHVREHSAIVDDRLAERGRQGNKTGVQTRLLRRKRLVSWTKYLPKKVRTRCRDHKKYFSEFAQSVGPQLSASKLTDETFDRYYEHVHSAARGKSNLTKPESGCLAGLGLRGYDASLTAAIRS